MIARGPFGIRTWFYNRRGTGGWERYLPADYPAFSGGQATAFAKLTELAKAGNVIAIGASSVRSMWTGENAPSQADLTSLQQGVLSIAQCSGLQPGLPARYTACTPPPGAIFSVADWTAVINEVLAEIFAAVQVNAHFSDLDTLRQKLFIAQGAELPAIGGALGLEVAAQTEAEFDEQEMWAGILELLGAVASLVPEGEPVAAALDVAGGFVSMLPSGTPSMTSKYETTYAGVQDQFAKHVSEAEKAQAVLSQEVRQDYRLLTLLANLRHQGTWMLDLTGMASVANQGFAVWAYKSLLPAVYDRYEITGCHPWDEGDDFDCHGPSDSSTYPGVFGSANGPDFTALGPPPEHGVAAVLPREVDLRSRRAAYSSLHSDLATRIFGDVSPTVRLPARQCRHRVDVRLQSRSESADERRAARRGERMAFHDLHRQPDAQDQVAATRRRLGARRRGIRSDAARPSVSAVNCECVPDSRLEGRGWWRHASCTRPVDAGSSRVRRGRPGRVRPTRAIPNRPRARVTLRRLGPRRLAFDIRMTARGLRVPHACAALPRSIRPRSRSSDSRRACG